MDEFCQYNLYKKARAKLFIPPSYARKAESKGDHKKVANLQLKASDPSKLLLLIESLKRSSNTNLQIKINTYLTEETGSDVVFFLSLIDLPNEAVLKVVGKQILKVDVHIPVTDPIFTDIINNAEGIHFKLEAFNSELIKLLKSNNQKLSGDVYGCSIFEQIDVLGFNHITDTPQFLVFVIGLQSQRLFISHLIQETFRFCLPHLVNTILHEESERENAQKLAMLSIVKKFFHSLTNLEEQMKHVLEYSKGLTNAARGSLYLLDKNQKLVEPIIFEGTDLKPEIFERNKGIVGHVITTKRVLNIKNPREHPLFLLSEDERLGLQTTNILCFPIINENIVLGAIQLCNKHRGNFNIFDEETVKVFGEYCGLSLAQAFQYKTIASRNLRNIATNQMLLSREHFQMRESTIKHLMYSKQPNYSDLSSPSFVPGLVASHQTSLMVLQMFQNLDLIDCFKIEKNCLSAFIAYIEHDYNNLPYHNWMHAFQATHFAYSLIISEKLVKRNMLSQLDVLALIIACIGHDIGHQSSNMSCSKGKCSINMMYTSPDSMCETYRYSQVLCILNDEKCDVLKNLSDAQHSECIEKIKRNILQTDINNHLKNFIRQQHILKKTVQYGHPDFKNLMSLMIMTCSDLCDQTKGWKMSRDVAIAFYEEYCETEEVTVSDDTSIKSSTRSKTWLPELQIEFLRKTVLPIFSSLVFLFPKYQFCIDSINDCLTKWELAKNIFSNRLKAANSLEVLRSKKMDFDSEEVEEDEEEETSSEELENDTNLQ